MDSTPIDWAVDFGTKLIGSSKIGPFNVTNAGSSFQWENRNHQMFGFTER